MPRGILGSGSPTLKLFQNREVQICITDHLEADEVGKASSRFGVCAQTRAGDRPESHLQRALLIRLAQT